MKQNSDNHPFTHWTQLLTAFLLPGALQGLGFYGIAKLSSESIGIDWRVFALWFLAITPSCFFLISVPRDRWRSLSVSVLLGLVLSALFFIDVRDAMDSDISDWVPPRNIAISVVCSLIVVFICLPFYRTRWQRGLPFHHYASLFEYAWNQTVCVLIGLLFTGLVFALMALSVQLFSAVGVDLAQFVFDSPFLGASLGAAFATAIGVTRQSDTVVLGTRVLILALLRVLLPVMLAISAVFIVLVATVGIEQLDTGLSVALIVLISAIVGITLCSARIGDATETLTRFQQILTRGMAAMVLPLSLLAAYALWIRIDTHGWTGDRVLAATVIALCLLYGLGYLMAAIGRVRSVIPKVNLAMAGVCGAVALLLMTPFFDPDGLGVSDQLARFDDGRTSAEQLDLGYLKFSSGRAGREALQALSMRAEAKESPLQERLLQLQGIDNMYELYSLEQGIQEMDSEQRESMVRALAAGTLRVLSEEAAGWTLADDAMAVVSETDSRFPVWEMFEFRLFCLDQGLDCAYLLTRNARVIVAIRMNESNLMLHRSVAATQNQDPYPQLLAEFTEEQGMTAEQLDTWFAALDRGELTVDTVRLPALVIGDFWVLQEDSTGRR